MVSAYNADRDLQAWESQFLYKNAARKLVSQDLSWIDRLSNPAVEKAWNYFHREVMERVEAEEKGSLIIEGNPPTAVVNPNNNLDV